MVQAKPAVLEKAPPPAHSVLLVASVIAASLFTLPSLESIDEHATVEAFTSTHYEWISMSTLAYVRLSFALFGLATSCYVMLYNEIEVIPTYKQHSKLKKPKKWVISGFTTHAFFTKWAWLLMSTSFALSGGIAYMVANGHKDYVEHHPWLLRAALLTFETAAPTEFLVAAVVKYALWPGVLASGRPAVGLRKPTSLIMHNVCVYMVLVELAILGNIPVELSHFPLAPLFGLVYILFAWFMSDKWRPCKEGDGPQFLYFFMDTTLGKETTISLLALLLLLSAFYFFFWMADDIVVHFPFLTGRVVAIGAVSSMVCRFHD